MRGTSFFAAVSLTAVIALGCGKKGEFDTAPLKGTVTYNGEPVTEGTIDIIPAPGATQQMVGKPAAATVNADGTFTAGTYGSSDGVVPGVKRIRYSAPLPPDTAEGAKMPPSKYLGMEIEPAEIEVGTDGGEFSFELKEAKKKR